MGASAYVPPKQLYLAEFLSQEKSYMYSQFLNSSLLNMILMIALECIAIATFNFL